MTQQTLDLQGPPTREVAAIASCLANPTSFRKWLMEHSSRHTWCSNPKACPIAGYLRYRGYNYVSVGLESIGAGFAFNGHDSIRVSLEYEVRPWVGTFIAFFDRVGYKNIQRDRVIAALDAALYALSQQRAST